MVVGIGDIEIVVRIDSQRSGQIQQRGRSRSFARISSGPRTRDCRDRAPAYLANAIVVRVGNVDVAV